MFPVKRILVPTDFSEYSERALMYAGALAKESHGKIYLLHVINQGAQQYVTDYALSPEITKRIENESIVSTEANLRSEGKKLSESGGVEIVPLMKKGFPEDEILRVAQEKNIELIVIANHGKTGLRRYPIGNVAEKVLRGSTCPVLLWKS